MPTKILLFSAYLFLAIHVQAAPYLDLGPMLGHVGPNEARIWAKASEPARMSIRIGRKPDLSDGVVHTGPELSAGNGLMGHAMVDGLSPTSRYFYAVLLNDQPAMVRPFPSFKTAPPKDTPAHTRIAFSSCFNARKKFCPAAAWADLAARAKADILLQLGDNHYGDSTDLKTQRTYFHRQRTFPGFREATSSTPTYAIWDDHDFGPNNSDRTTPGKENALRAFKEHFANPSYGEPDNPGIYFTFKHGQIEFFMLDVRYYRDPDNAPVSPDKTLLGKRQKAWLKKKLKTSTAKIKIICSGSEFQMNGPFDSWTSYDHEQKEFFDFIRDEKLQGVLLLSGDRHFTGAYQIEGRVIEITAGPMSSPNFESLDQPDMFLNFGVGKMYCVLDIDTRPKQPVVILEIYRAGDGLIHIQKLAWDEINGKKAIPTLFDRAQF